VETISDFHYVAYRRRNPEREPGTCQWITSHPQFQSWINADIYSILWISGDPGCGKSVAASYLVSHLQEIQPSALVAYFFFKDDSDKQSKAISALCSVLHQILLGKEDSIDRAAKKFVDQGNDAESRFFCLWEILVDAL
jgi:Cdc6-like AAA superfamily ATPase